MALLKLSVTQALNPANGATQYQVKNFCVIINNAAREFAPATSVTSCQNSRVRGAWLDEHLLLELRILVQPSDPP
jgi:hypothetical protein